MNSNDLDVPFTVSACFKQPPHDLVPEAWRILRAVCAGRELCPSWAVEYERKCLARWKQGHGGEEEHADDEVGVVVEPGSASSPPAPPPEDDRAAEVEPASGGSIGNRRGPKRAT